jgi:phosphoglycolate phosphatase
MCLKKYQVKAIESLFVGDSSTDAQTAKNGGVKVWLMPYGYNQGTPLENSKPDYIASGFEEILNLI